MSLWCRHNWTLIDKTELPAPMDRVKSLSGGSDVPNWFCRRAVILALQCQKCGKLVVEKRENP